MSIAAPPMSAGPHHGRIGRPASSNIDAEGRCAASRGDRRAQAFPLDSAIPDDRSPSCRSAHCRCKLDLAACISFESRVGFIAARASTCRGRRFSTVRAGLDSTPSFEFELHHRGTHRAPWSPAPSNRYDGLMTKLGSAESRLLRGFSSGSTRCDRLGPQVGV